jgi:hypothetical protein
MRITLCGDDASQPFLLDVTKCGCVVDCFVLPGLVLIVGSSVSPDSTSGLVLIDLVRLTQNF